MRINGFRVDAPRTYIVRRPQSVDVALNVGQKDRGHLLRIRPEEPSVLGLNIKEDEPVVEYG